MRRRTSGERSQRCFWRGYIGFMADRPCKSFRYSCTTMRRAIFYGSYCAGRSILYIDNSTMNIQLSPCPDRNNLFRVSTPTPFYLTNSARVVRENVKSSDASLFVKMSVRSSLVSRKQEGARKYSTMGMRWRAHAYDRDYSLPRKDHRLIKLTEVSQASVCN